MRTLINITSMWCESTTDNFLQGSHDEVTWAISAKRSDGKVYSTTLPSGGGDWEAGTNDDDSPKMVVGATNVWDDDLADGQWVELLVTCIELDNGGSDKYKEAAGAVVQATDGNIYAVLGQLVLDIFGGFLNDDLLGSFSIKATNSGNQITYETRGVQYATSYQEPGVTDKQFFRLENSGGRYSIAIQAVAG